MTARAQRWRKPLIASLLLHLVLIQPNHPEAMTWGALKVFPLELPVILLALLALGECGASRVLRGLLAVALTVIVTLKTADFVSFSALSRGFNPVSDLPLVEAFVRLMAGTIGPMLTGAAVVAALLAIGLVFWLLWWAAGVWSRIATSGLVARASGVVAVLAAGIAVADIGAAMGRWTLPASTPGAAFTARVGVERVVMARETLVELRNFRASVAQDSFAGVGNLLDGIDRDVLVVFIESYGRTSIDTPFYAEQHRTTLAEYEARLTGLGLAVQSGYLRAPTRGGQSWLSHASFSGGLWIDNQISYGAALSSGRETLFHHAGNNGFRTAAVMPQITLDWPESQRMGFETVLVSKDLGYKGLPFNWVTMPDQFTLAALDRLLRDGADQRRLFAQIALASSHAPWVPVPKVIAWEDIGDGQIYNETATSGDAPEVVWQDRDRVRAQYRLAIDYALRAVFEYAVLHAEEPPLMLVVGDHQAAEFVALDDRPDVPIHVIGPAHLVEALGAVAPQPGLVPGDEVPVISMDRMRDILLKTYSTPSNAGPTN